MTGITTEDEQLDDAARAVVVDGESQESAIPDSEVAPSLRRRELLVAGGAYLVLSFFIWWNVWTSHPSSITTCGCGDSASAISGMEWPAYAVTHGLNPLYTTLLNHPTGINLVATPGALAVSVPLVPVTWLFGPVASLNVVLTLAPALSALAMFLLLRRWVSWAPAAFLGGLFYGFCPFILVSLTLGWIILAMAPIPPLIVLCLDELLLRQRRRPERVGVVLGLLVTLQFFVSTEILVVVTIMAACGTALIIIYTALKFPEALARNARPAFVGLGVAAATAVCLLAYPFWFAVAGPAHFNGLQWANRIPSYDTNVLQYFVHPAPTSVTFVSVFWRQTGGYQGTLLSLQYFGAGVIIVLLAGLVVWRRDRRLWFFGAITVISGALSLAHRYPLPFVDNLLPGRVVIVTYLAVAVMLALILDHTHESINQLRVNRQEVRSDVNGSRSPRVGLSLGAMAAAIVAAIAIVPTADYLTATLPITTQRVVLPTWFRTVAPHLRAKQVLLVFPTYFAGGYESASAWQAVDEMPYSMVNAAGSEGIVARAGTERAGAAVIARTAQGISPDNLNASGIRAVRKALIAWGITTIVIPDQLNLPLYDRVPSAVAAAELMTAATGERPIHQADAWVWSARRFAPSVVRISGIQIRECTLQVAAPEVLAVEPTTACVLKSGDP